MDAATVMTIGRDSILTMLLLMLPPLGIALAVGLLISVIQAATQVQEMTLAFVPKIIAVFLVVLVCAPWMANVMLTFAARLFGGFPALVR